jgi:hypothetical protein
MIRLLKRLATYLRLQSGIQAQPHQSSEKDKAIKAAYYLLKTTEWNTDTDTTEFRKKDEAVKAACYFFVN